jgi:hypothetical protein
MSRTRKDEAPILVEAPEIEGRYVELDDTTVAFERFPVDTDPAPLFRGLPDDRCQSPHWGIVVKGSITFRYADGEETIGEGEVYYAAPGHTPVLTAGTELLEFSPTEKLNETIEVVVRNAAAMLPSS